MDVWPSGVSRYVITFYGHGAWPNRQYAFLLTSCSQAPRKRAQRKSSQRPRPRQGPGHTAEVSIQVSFHGVLGQDCIFNIYHLPFATLRQSVKQALFSRRFSNFAWRHDVLGYRDIHRYASICKLLSAHCLLNLQSVTSAPVLPLRTGRLGSASTQTDLFRTPSSRSPPSGVQERPPSPALGASTMAYSPRTAELERGASRSTPLTSRPSAPPLSLTPSDLHSRPFDSLTLHRRPPSPSANFGPLVPLHPGSALSTGFLSSFEEGTANYNAGSRSRRLTEVGGSLLSPSSRPSSALPPSIGLLPMPISPPGHPFAGQHTHPDRPRTNFGSRQSKAPSYCAENTLPLLSIDFLPPPRPRVRKNSVSLGTSGFASTSESGAALLFPPIGQTQQSPRRVSSSGSVSVSYLAPVHFS